MRSDADRRAGSPGEESEDRPPAPEVPGDPVAACPQQELAPSPVRRLSRAEYLATVRDLLPGVDMAGIDLAIDATSNGFENQAALLIPSQLVIEKYADAARLLAERALTRLQDVLPCDPAGDETACGAAFVDRFGARAFRRPLDADERKKFTSLFERHRTEISFRAAVQLGIEAFLQSPEFLYRVEFGDPSTRDRGSVRLTDHELATRISYLLWGSMPDETLFGLATEGRLRDPTVLAEEVQRMLADPRLSNMMLDFHRQWLDLDRVFREKKDPAIYPMYTDHLRASIREEADRFVQSVMAEGDGTIASLLTQSNAPVNAELAALYGVEPPTSGWQTRDLAAGERSGLLTRANFLAGHAHGEGGSPPLRAVFVMTRLMCMPPPPPPNDVDTSPPTAQPGDGPKTNRQLFAEGTRDAGCQGCHRIIDPIGFGFEHYDAIGRYRTQDNGLPVDASGALADIDGAGPFNGGVELSRKLADSQQVLDCVAGHLYQFAFGRKPGDGETCKVGALGGALADAGGDVRELLVAITRTSDFLYRSEVTP